MTGGIVTAQDSSWLLSWTVNRQPHFVTQPEDQTVVRFYSLFTDKPGDYVAKAMRDCTGYEITREWLFHMGVPVDQIDELARDGTITRPCMMPFIDAFFLPRNGTDRPKVIPDTMTNFAFIGQFAEAGTRDVIFTVEYSVRTAMEAVYRFLDVERGVPEVFNSIYDVRQLIKSAAILRDHKPIPVPAVFRKFIEKNELGRMLAQFGAIADSEKQPAPTGAVTPKGS